jgi:protein TonB
MAGASRRFDSAHVQERTNQAHRMLDQHPFLATAEPLALPQACESGHRPMALLSHMPGRSVRLLGTLSGGVALEGVILAALFGWLQPAPDNAVPVPVAFAFLPPPDPAPEPPPDPVPPEPAPVPPPPTPPEPKSETPPPPGPTPPAVARPVAPAHPAPHRPSVPPPAAGLPEALPPAAEASPPASPPPPVPTAAAAAPAERQAEDTLRGRIRDAVQAASRCPPAARMMGLGGRAGVGFDYRDGALVGAPYLMRSTGSALLDAAALAAVRQARYPKPTPEIGERLLRLLIWVDEACTG